MFCNAIMGVNCIVIKRLYYIEIRDVVRERDMRSWMMRSVNSIMLRKSTYDFPMSITKCRWRVWGFRWFAKYWFRLAGVNVSGKTATTNASGAYTISVTETTAGTYTYDVVYAGGTV